MTETPTAADLEIPDAAIEAMLTIDDDWDDDEHLTGAVRYVAASVVAAELRRIANEWDLSAPYAAKRLRARADELDPPSRQEDCR